MAWTTPRTWVTGELVTSAMLNTHVRDNLNYLYSTTGEVSYAEVTSPVTVTATTEATANTIVTAAAIAFSGSDPVDVECFLPDASNAGGGTLNITLFDGSTAIGQLAGSTEAGTAIIGLLKRRMTPAAGTRTYSIRGWRATANWTINVGVGGLGARLPGYIRITRTS